MMENTLSFISLTFQKLSIPLSAQQVDDLMEVLDPNHTGTINFG